MAKNLIKIIAIIGVAVIQILLMPHFALYGVWPNLSLILALMLLFFNADPEALFAASLGGVILDLASPLTFGLFTASLILITLAIKLLMSKFFNEPNVFIMIFIMALALVTSNGLESLLARQFSPIIILINVIYGLLISLLFYRLLNFWMDRSQGIRFKI